MRFVATVNDAPSPDGTNPDDTVEPVSGVGSTCMSLLRRILRDSGEIRQTSDMQCVNKAVVYKEGNSNIADPLSRLCSESNCPAPVNFVMRITEAHADCVAKSAVSIAMTWEEIREASLDCLEIKQVIESLRADSMKKCSTAIKL